MKQNKKRFDVFIMLFILILIAIIIDILMKDHSNEVLIEGSQIIDKIPDTTLKEIEDIIDNNLRSETATPKTVVVRISSNQFVPKNITINKGTTVIWVNEDHRTHKLASTPLLRNGSFYREFYGTTIPEEGTYNHTFNEVGILPYFDVALLKSLRGTIEIVE